ncbi:MAG: hypothetical protein KAS39_05260 [Actinomycetia bacterium]|nr:hypothetical protein [Actinomycetes bacterium]
MKDKIYLRRSHGIKSAVLRNDSCGFELTTIRNGTQASGMPVDDIVLKLIWDVINKYFEGKKFGGEKDEFKTNKKI